LIEEFEKEEIILEEEDSKEIETEGEIFDQVKTTRSGKVSKPVHKYITMHHAHLQT
jgi:hypothetical protein